MNCTSKVFCLTFLGALQYYTAMVMIYYKERPLNTVDCDRGMIFPDNLNRFELKLGEISTIAELLPL